MMEHVPQYVKRPLDGLELEAIGALVGRLALVRAQPLAASRACPLDLLTVARVGREVDLAIEVLHCGASWTRARCDQDSGALIASTRSALEGRRWRAAVSKW